MSTKTPTAPTDHGPFVLSEHFEPVRMVEVDIGAPLPEIPHLASGLKHSLALSLVWLHDQPLGLVPLTIPECGIPPSAYAQEIWRHLHSQITAHLIADGLDPIDSLDALGICDCDFPPCRTHLEELRVNGPLVSVVVPTHDRPERIESCVLSLLAQDYRNFEIIIADNGPSSTDTEDIIREKFGDDPRVRYVSHPRAGTSWARNKGMELANGTLTAFCDDDVRHDPRWLTQLVRGFEFGPRVGCVTGLVLPQELETLPQVWLEQYGGYAKGFELQIYDLQEHIPDDRLFPFTTGRLGTGANMAFRTETLRSLGGFDPALGGGSRAIGGEDLAMSFQVIASGYQLVYQPAAVVYHPHYREYSALRRQMYGYGKGLTAYLTKCLIDHPQLGIDMLRKLPVGLDYVFSPRSRKNRRKAANYPRELTMVEFTGMVHGPFAYLRGRWSREDS